MMLAELSPEAYRKASDIADAVAGLAPPARGVELDRLCGGDTGLRAVVDLLLTADADGAATTGTELPEAARSAETTPPASDTAPLHPAVPGYEILGEIGRGGMGVVYKARHRGLNRLVALKMVLAGELAGHEELARCRGEARHLAQLGHPNIVQIYDVGEYQGRPYLAMEFMGAAVWPRSSAEDRSRSGRRPS
jgi:hypothetical protein